MELNDPIKKKEYGKEYYKKNKDAIKEKMKEMIKCECGGEYTKYNKGNHEKTQKHLDGIKNKKVKYDEISEKITETIKKNLEIGGIKIEENIKKMYDKEIIEKLTDKIMKELCGNIGALVNLQK
jgi:hypothetical protein